MLLISEDGTVDLSNKGLKEFPKELFAPENVKRIKILNLSYNRISVIPDTLGALVALTSLQKLYLYNNQISVIPDAIATLTSLQILYLSDNQISVIPDAIAALTSLQELYLYNNRISLIPVSLSRLRNLISFLFSGNPIEYIPPQIRRLLERQKTGQNIYQDSQSVHNSKIQESFRKTVEKFSQRKPKLTENQTLEEILTSKLNLESKNGLLEWCFEKEIYSLNLTFLEILVFVWDRIRCHPSKEEILKVLDSELQDAICKCPTGRITRLVNCLNGFDPEVVLEISENEQISYLYDIAKKSEDPKKTFIKMMQERKYNQNVIDLWSSEM
jgi:Leucine-rich repeat (LRR) protein